MRPLGAPTAALILAAARLSTRRRGVVVVYHGIGDPQGDWTRELVPALGTRLFESQLSHLRRLYRVVPASRIVEATRERRRGERFPVAITLDDDLLSHERTAAPLLERLGLSATFFLSGASLEQPYTFWWERLQKASDLGLPIERLVQRPPESIHSIAKTIESMPAEERAAVTEQLGDWIGSDCADTGLLRDAVAALAGAGFEIGFHTLEHHRLPTLDEAGREISMNEGRDQLGEAAGERIDLIAYPHGAADHGVVRAAASAGYRFGFTTEPEPVTPETDRLLIGRVGPSYISAGHFAIKVVATLLRRTKSS